MPDKMYIDEYIQQHPLKLPEGQELMEFSGHCEEYLDMCRDLVPYEDLNYVSKVFDMCISMASADLNPNEYSEYIKAEQSYSGKQY